MSHLEAIDFEFLAGRRAFLPGRPWGSRSRIRPEAPRLGTYARLLAEELGLDGQLVDRIALVAPWHDIGKVFVDPAILDKPGPLSGVEQLAMRRHSMAGAVLLSGRRHPVWMLASLVALTHHERWDGTGYPFGLRETEIPLAARIVAVADAYDALRSPRPYKWALDHETVRRVLLVGDERTRPTHFDPEVLAAFSRREAAFARVHLESDRALAPLPEAACF